MRTKGYSLIEVVVAAAVVAVGLTAAAVLASTLMQQEEVNAAALRAANLQEQAITLYRLGISPGQIAFLLPEPSGYDVNFTTATEEEFEVDGTKVRIDVSSCSVTYPDPSGNGQNLSSTVTVVRPTIRGTGD